jgi:hypothetical protein
MNWLSEFGKFIQQTAKTWLGLFLASGFLWLFPKLVVVGDAADKSNSYFGAAVRVIFVLSAAMLFSDLAFYVRDYIRDRNAKIKVLKRLTPPERGLLSTHLKMGKNSFRHGASDPVIVSLLSKKLVSIPMNIVDAFHPDDPRPVPIIVITEWAYYHLKGHPELIT